MPNRWEWRTFGLEFPAAEAVFARRTASGTKDSDELYLLSGGDNVKVRDDLMDVKVLRHVDADGLQQWEPVMKGAFPLPADAVTKVLAAFRLDSRVPQRATYTLAEFVEEFTGASTGVRAIAVHKRRTRYTLGTCMAELSEIVADGRSTRTIAVEGEDAAAVVATVRELGLGGYVNTDYLAGLAALVDARPASYCVIDVGTNSIKFHVGERSSDGVWRAIVDRAEVTRLGEGLADGGRIASDPMTRTAAAIAVMVDEAKRLGVRAIAAVGTAGLRMASNRDEVLAAIRERAGIDVEVISGEEEGRLAYLAVQAGVGVGSGSLVVFDTGGGSSQFTFGHGASVDERFSVDVGAVRYTERFGLAGVVTPEVLRETLAAIAADLVRIDGREPPHALVGMGGGITNITAVKHGLAKYDPDVVQGSVLDRAEIERQIELYSSRTADARRAIVGLQPQRAEVILAGACIVRTIMEKLGQDALTVSDRSLRHGVLVERFGG